MSAGCQEEIVQHRPQPPFAPARQPLRLPSFPRLLIPALLSAALLWLCYFPLDCGWLGWIALIPLLSLVRSPAAPRRVYLAAWACGLAFFWVALQWLRVADYRMYFTWAGLATYCSLYFPVAIFLIRRLDRHTSLPLLVSVPVVWTSLEFARAHLMGGFAWYFLGHSQHAFLPVIQIADLGGSYAVTFLVAMVNALLFELLYCWKGFRARLSLPDAGPTSSRSALLLQSGLVGVLLAATLGYGWWRVGQQDFEPGPRLALLQGNLDQQVRNDSASQLQARDTVNKHFMELCDAASLQRQRADLIVWPETSFIYGWGEISPDLPPERVPSDWQGANEHRTEQAHAAARRWQTNLLLGVNTMTLGADSQERRYNSAVYVTRDGKIGGRYDKIHCIPFGEYVPFRETLPWMKTFAPYDFDYSVTPGERLLRFPLGAYHFGVLICYEDTDASLARQYALAADGAPAADFLVNISNDGWFNGTSEHEEHLAICRFRAIETRRSVARAVNMGVSAVIDGNGRVVDLPRPTWRESKKIAAIVQAVVPIDHRASPYARWGDWLPASCGLVLCFGLVAGSVRMRRLLSAGTTGQVGNVSADRGSGFQS
jgi:apolipoprotein N-acyltransferase